MRNILGFNLPQCHQVTLFPSQWLGNCPANAACTNRCPNFEWDEIKMGESLCDYCEYIMACERESARQATQ